MTATASPRPRPPLDLDRLAAALADGGWEGPPPRVVESTGSTNADLAAAAVDGAPEWSVLVTEEQTAGRGRLGRRWAAPARSSVLASVLLRPRVDPSRWGWLPLMTGVAVTDALAPWLPGAAWLKWPNDVVVDGADRDGGPGPRKLAGLLVERVTESTDAVVVGMGVNVDLQAEELPVPTATSLVLEGAGQVDRAALLAGLLASLRRRYGLWQSAAGDAERCGLASSYRRRCLTLGRPVVAVMPGDRRVEGLAEEVLADGSLALLASTGRIIVAAGDVIHLR